VVDHIDDLPAEAARAVSARTCEACGTPIGGRRQQRFCSGACRARFSRERREREIAAKIERLTRLADVSS
jgi:predicted nucleic acid-binding Zn ribbon protein